MRVKPEGAAYGAGCVVTRRVQLLISAEVARDMLGIDPDTQIVGASFSPRQGGLVCLKIEGPNLPEVNESGEPLPVTIAFTRQPALTATWSNDATRSWEVRRP